VATRFVRKGTKQLVRHAKKLGVSVIILPAGISSSQLAAQMNRRRLPGRGQSDA
jgi:hypothetical protein